MNNGFALLGALIVTLILAILGTGVVVFVSRNNQDTISYTSGIRSFYALQAGIEFAERKASYLHATLSEGEMSEIIPKLQQLA